MKFKVNREKFQKALQRVVSIIGARSILPMLGNVLLEAGDGNLKLTTTDLDIRITTNVEAEVSDPGTGTVPARRLAQLVGSFTAPELELETDAENHCRIVCGTGKFLLLGLPAEDFPAQSDFETVRSFKLKENDFKHMIGSIAYAVSIDDSRKVLTGVLMSIHDSLLTMVATDGKRMAMRETAPEDFNGADGNAIVPIKAIQEVKRMLEGNDSATVEFGEKQCRIRTAAAELTTKLIEGSYPNFRQVIPTKWTRTVEAPVPLFLSKIEMVSLMLSESSSYIILNFGDNKMKIMGASSEIGEGSDEIDVEYTADPFEVSFNPSYLADPMRNTASETVRMKFNDPLTPVTIETEEGFLYVIMPIRKK